MLLALVAAGVAAAAMHLGDSYRREMSSLASNLGNEATSEPATSTSDVSSSGDVSSSTPRWLRFETFGLQTGLVLCWTATTLLYVVAISRRRAAQSAASQTLVVPKALQARFVSKRQEILRVLNHDPQESSWGQLRVRQIMTSRVTTVDPETPLEVLHSTMRDHETRHLLVASSDGRLQGIVSDRDLKPGDGRRRARQIMASQPLTVDAESLVCPAVTLMLERRVSCLPVLRGDRLVGIVTTTDLLMALQCLLQLVENIQSQLGSNDEGTSATASPVEQAAIA